MNIRHIPIPFDELQLFKQQEKYQNYLIETLIYSTRVVLHRNKQKIKCIMAITKHRLWLQPIDKPDKKSSVNLKNIELILKSQQHPQIVLMTDENNDNLRVSTANEERCQNIISALSFYCTYLSASKQSLILYFVKQNSLLYFERTVKQKRNGIKISVDRYTQHQIKYIQPNNSPDLFGKIIIHKLALTKQIYSENQHFVHIAKVNQKQFYLCHMISKEQQYAQSLKKHSNLDFVQKLQYVRSLQYKIQLFFEFTPSFKSGAISHSSFFKEIFHLYDKMKQYSPNSVLTLNMIVTSSQNPAILLLRQFRYQFLTFDCEVSKFLYKKVEKEVNESDIFINKMYNIGLVLYHQIFGRALFDHEDLQLMAKIKFNMKKVPFPLYMNTSITKTLKMFVQDCLLGKLSNLKQIKQHPWVKKQKIQL